jgi:formylglycine-generating enzyme required for sulfatase activity
MKTIYSILRLASILRLWLCAIGVIVLCAEAHSAVITNVTRDRAHINSLGMEFLPAGTSNVLVSRWETRVQDFAAFVKATGYDAFSESTDGKRPFTLEADAASASGYDWKQAGGSWQDPHFPQTPKHPATCVSYHDAVRFCAWLTRHEADQGTLPSGWRYRLPADEEWSRAAGAAEYPWGDHWPPTPHDGNYCGTESRLGFTDTPKWKCMEIFRDSHPRTAPVGSYASNAFGLFDMGGNVWEWCSTWYRTNLNQADLNDPAVVVGFPALLDDGGGRQNRVVRGGSWHAQRQVDMRSRFRGIGDPRIRFDDFGFRCVLAQEDTTP